VNECTPDGWRDKAGAAVADWSTVREISRRGIDGAVPRVIVPQSSEERSDLVDDPNYPSDAVIREVARKLADLFSGE
jgi:hypothetical protein